MAGGIKLHGKLVGAETIVENVFRMRESMKERLRRAIWGSATEVAAEASGLAPRATGNLASSIRVTGEETDRKIVAQVGSDLHYAKYQESGWTPNPRRKTDTTIHTQVVHQSKTVTNKKGIQRTKIRFKEIKVNSWRRNPRSAKAWAERLGTTERKIFSHPFLKPALAMKQASIRQKLADAVNG